MATKRKEGGEGDKDIKRRERVWGRKQVLEEGEEDVGRSWGRGQESKGCGKEARVRHQTSTCCLERSVVHPAAASDWRHRLQRGCPEADMKCSFVGGNVTSQHAIACLN